MQPVDQTVLHDPENGIHGNCLSAVLASLLHLPIEDIPVFSNPNQWVQDLNLWLRPYGLAYLNFGPADGSSLFKEFGIEGCYHEVAGKTSRFNDTLHACVGRDGVVIHDPHPSKTGLLSGPNDYGVFIALRPWEVVHGPDV